MHKKMIKAFLLLLPALLIGQLTVGQINTGYQKFAADTVKSTIDAITKELSAKHPGFYRYTSKKDFALFIDSVKNTIKDSLTVMQFYTKLKLVTAKINCLHSGISLNKQYTDYLNQQPNLFPFQVYFSNGKAYIVKNYSAVSAIETGDEVLSINGQSIDTITARLLSLIPSDGYNLTLKYRALYLQFATWYRIIDVSENFTTVIKHNGKESTYAIKGAKFNEIAEDGFLKEPLRTKQLEFTIENDIAFLTIHSFAQSDIKKAKQDFKAFIDQAFDEINTKKIKNLVVDLRDNTGGSDGNAAYFTRHFFDKPFRYWDRIEVTEAIAKETKGIGVTLFYRKPIRKDSVWLWQKAKHVNDFDFYEEQSPAKNNFNGNTYVLINGFCMSSCADVTAVLSYNKKAVFIGEETGGGYQGNNSGMMPETAVTPYFTLTVPLQKYFNSVDTLTNVGRGTMPDYTISLTVDEVIKGQDKAMQKAIEVIKSTGK